MGLDIIGKVSKGVGIGYGSLKQIEELHEEKQKLYQRQ